MFLATTALQEYWSADGPLLLLGEWCGSRDSLPGGRDYVLADDPWKDQQDISAAYRLCAGLMQQMLGPLGQALEEVHGDRRTQRGWNLVLGPWLYSFISLSYHHYRCLKAAKASHADLSTFGPTRDSFCPAPQDTLGYFMRARTDLFNLQLFCELAERLGVTVSRERAAPATGESDRRQSSDALYRNRVARQAGTRLRHRLQNVIRPLVNGALGWQAARSQCIMYQSALTRREEIELALSSGLRLIPWVTPSETPVLQSSYDEAMRNRIREHFTAGASDVEPEFTAMVVAMLPAYLPFSFAENYHALSASAHSAFPPYPDAVASAVGWIADDRFKIWVAGAADSGTRLIGMQHGGGYGMRAIPALSEHIELSVLDTFVSWGWTLGRPEVVPAAVPPHFFTPARQSISKPATERPVMFVGTACHRFPNQFASEPSGPRFLEYIDYQKRFLGALSGDARAELLLRLQPEDLGWNNEGRLLAAFSDINVDRRNKFDELLNSSRLVIVDNLNTTMFQSIGRNIPTVLFWDRGRWDTNAEAAEQLDRLMSVGIFHDTPEGAARHIMSIMVQPEQWWLSGPVQSAVAGFLTLYMRRSSRWRREWRELFDGIVATRPGRSGPAEHRQND